MDVRFLRKIQLDEIRRESIHNQVIGQQLGIISFRIRSEEKIRGIGHVYKTDEDRITRRATNANFKEVKGVDQEEGGEKRNYFIYFLILPFNNITY